MPFFPPTTMLFVLLGLAALSREAGATEFVLKGNPVCKNGLGLNINYMMCNGNRDICDLGEEVFMYGYMTQYNPYITETVHIKSKACLFGMNNAYTSALTCNTYSMDVDFCSTFGIGYDGCPEQGEYAVNVNFVLPGSGGLSLAGGWWITIYTDIYAITETDPNAYDDGTPALPIEQCETKISAVKTTSGSSTAANFLLGLSMVVFASFGTWFFRKRQTACIDLSQEEDRAESGDFEMMTDNAVTV